MQLENWSFDRNEGFNAGYKRNGCLCWRHYTLPCSFVQNAIKPKRLKSLYGRTFNSFAAAKLDIVCIFLFRLVLNICAIPETLPQFSHHYPSFHPFRPSASFHFLDDRTSAPYLRQSWSSLPFLPSFHSFRFIPLASRQNECSALTTPCHQQSWSSLSFLLPTPAFCYIPTCLPTERVLNSNDTLPSTDSHGHHSPYFRPFIPSATFPLACRQNECSTLTTPYLQQSWSSPFFLPSIPSYRSIPTCLSTERDI
jgi:hypothetical protein